MKTYKFLGVQIDDCLRLDKVLATKQEKTKALRKKQFLFNSKGLDGTQRYNIYNTLFRSSIWYESILCAQYSQKIREWC